jgi:hypothetical protein
MVSSILLVSPVNGEVSAKTTSAHSAEGSCRFSDFVWIRTFWGSGSGLMRINEEKDQKLHRRRLATNTQPTHYLNKF